MEKRNIILVPIICQVFYIWYLIHITIYGCWWLYLHFRKEEAEAHKCRITFPRTQRNWQNQDVNEILSHSKAVLHLHQFSRHRATCCGGYSMPFCNTVWFFWNATLTCSQICLPDRAKSAFSTPPPPPLLRFGLLYLHWSGLKWYTLRASSTSDVQVLFLVEARSSPNSEPCLSYMWSYLSSPYPWKKKSFTSPSLQMRKIPVH